MLIFLEPKINKSLNTNDCYVTGLKIFDVSSCCAPYVQQTFFWEAQNIKHENFCVAIILLEKIMEI